VDAGGSFGGAATRKEIPHDSSKNSSASLNTSYPTDSAVMRFKSLSYFIAPGTDGLRSLWRYDNTQAANATASATTAANPVELVANVADMQIEYGVDTNGNETPNYYVGADNVPNWTSVIAVRVSLLVQTPGDNLTPTNQTYFYNHASTNAPDNRLYRVFTSTIQLRNTVS